jgi:hypothetical protein
MDKTYYYVSIEYNGQSIDFDIQLPINTDIKKLEKELREEIQIEITKEG